MKTMEDYVGYCTEEQTKRAYKSGAPIYFLPYQFENSTYIRNKGWGEIPTTQQMIGWLEQEKDLTVGIADCKAGWDSEFHKLYTMPIRSLGSKYKTKLEAELVAIDAALDYLEKEK